MRRPPLVARPLLLLVLVLLLACRGSSARVARPVITQVALFGAMHSGSNLLEDMIRANFPVRVLRGAHTGWKHTPPDAACTSHARVNLKKTLVVSIARDPVVYFERMHYDSYELMCGCAWRLPCLLSGRPAPGLTAYHLQVFRPPPHPRQRQRARAGP